MITKVHERTVPMFLNIFIINILIFRVWSNLANSSLKKFFIAYCITYFILFCSTLLKRKYSVHVASFCCGIPLLINQTTSYYLNPFIFLPCLLIILGLIASARLYLKAHTNMEIIMGAVIGFTPSFIVFFL